ncbi:MAG TPA: dTMP kinase [Clostridia bacterium]|nr:dTMP kinase [Clostridia bacterium]
MQLTGLFITIEGPDGAGKSTQVRLLAAYLQQQGWPVVLTREPGGTELAEKIRGLLLEVSGEPVTPVAEVLLYAASRAQHVEYLIKPALAKGAVVISDRFVDSSVAYQGYGRGLGAELVWQINEPALGGLLPHLTIVLDIDPEAGLQRLAQRSQEHRTGLDRLEREALDFHRRVREGFLQLARQFPDRVAVLSAAGRVEEVHQQIIALVSRSLAKKV